MPQSSLNFLLTCIQNKAYKELNEVRAKKNHHDEITCFDQAAYELLLYEAALDAEIEIVKYLLIQNVNVNMRTPHEGSILLEAVFLKGLCDTRYRLANEMMTLLLNAGAIIPKYLDIYGNVDAAKTAFSPEIIARLEKRGAHPIKSITYLNKVFSLGRQYNVTLDAARSDELIQTISSTSVNELQTQSLEIDFFKAPNLSEDAIPFQVRGIYLAPQWPQRHSRQHTSIFNKIANLEKTLISTSVYNPTCGWLLQDFKTYLENTYCFEQTAFPIFYANALTIWTMLLVAKLETLPRDVRSELIRFNHNPFIIFAEKQIPASFLNYSNNYILHYGGNPLTNIFTDYLKQEEYPQLLIEALQYVPTVSKLPEHSCLLDDEEEFNILSSENDTRLTMSWS